MKTKKILCVLFALITASLSGCDYIESSHLDSTSSNLSSTNNSKENSFANISSEEHTSSDDTYVTSSSSESETNKSDDNPEKSSSSESEINKEDNAESIEAVESEDPYNDFWNTIPIVDEMDLNYKYSDFYDGIVITKLYSDAEYVNLPSEIDGKKVKALEDVRSEYAKTIRIPDSVTRIDGGSFLGSTSLEFIYVPSGVLYIEGGAFRDCTSLENIVLPNSLIKIDYCAFANCSSLTSIELPNSISEIEYNVFEGCTSLSSITIPDSVTKINSGAFLNCTSLRTVSLPNSVNRIEKRYKEAPFGGCVDISITYKGKTYNENNIEKLYDKNLTSM